MIYYIYMLVSEKPWIQVVEMNSCNVNITWVSQLFYCLVSTLISPYPYGLVFSTAAYLLSVRTPVHRVHFVLVPGEVHGKLSGA